MGGVSSHGRRARRRRPAPRAPVGPVAGWLAFSLVMGAGVLLATGLSPLSVLALVGAGAVVGGVLLAAVRLSPPVDAPDAPDAPDGPDGPDGPDVGPGDGGAP